MQSLWKYDRRGVVHSSIWTAIRVKCVYCVLRFAMLIHIWLILIYWGMYHKQISSLFSYEIIFLNPTNQTFHQFHDLDTDFDLHRITSGFHGALATGVACQQGTLTLPDTWFRPPIWDLLMLQLLGPNSSNLLCLYSTFHLEYPLVLSGFCLTQYIV